MEANGHSPLKIDGHTSNFWCATQSSFTTRRAIRVLSMKHEESCSARRTKRWNTFNQLKIPFCSSQNELPTSLEYGRHVNWPMSLTQSRRMWMDIGWRQPCKASCLEHSVDVDGFESLPSTGQVWLLQKRKWLW